jgi:LacI family transcriptional regulator
VDGLLFDHIEYFPARLRQQLEESSVPVVWINDKGPHDCVYPDDFAAGFGAARALLELGHTRIAFTDHVVSGHFSAPARRQGCRAALGEVGLELEVFPFALDDMTRRDDFSPLSAWLSSPLRPTAIVAYEAYHALPLLVTALALGLKLPRDLSLVTFHERVPDLGALQVATMEIPMREMGRAAVEMLMDKIERPDDMLPSIALPFTFRQGHTLAPPLA